MKNEKRKMTVISMKNMYLMIHTGKKESERKKEKSRKKEKRQ